MKIAFPPVNPLFPAIWVVTQSVWDNCVLPVRNSPNASVIAIDSSPPPINLLRQSKKNKQFTAGNPIRMHQNQLFISLLKLKGSRCDAEDLLSLDRKLECSQEKVSVQFGTAFLNFFHFGFRETLDVAQLLLCTHLDTLYSADPDCLQLFDVSNILGGI